MWYAIIALLILTTNVIAFKVGKKYSETVTITKILDSVDSKDIASGQYCKAFTAMLETILQILHPGLKTDPTPSEHDIIDKEKDE